MARGKAFADVATDKDGFQKAATEFQAAAKVAPWLTEVYYNLGIVQDKAGLHKQAMQSLELYLLAAPNASDAREVRNLIYRLEALQEESQKAARKATEVKNKQRGIEELAGIWRLWGNQGYDEVFHLRGEVTGNGLLWIKVFDKDFPPQTRAWRAGSEKPIYRIWQKGPNIVGSTVDYNSSLSSQEIGVTVSKDYKKITFVEWYKFMKPPKRTLVYYKCRNSSPSSCGR
jgi:tetratricopeptide (TPR) repeat protein